MTQKNNKIKNLFSNVVYCVVLGVGLWAQNAVADIPDGVVISNNGSCPSGYVLFSLGGDCQYNPDFGFIFYTPTFDKNINPTSVQCPPISRPPFGTLPQVFCAKKCSDFDVVVNSQPAGYQITWAGANNFISVKAKNEIFTVYDFRLATSFNGITYDFLSPNECTKRNGKTIGLRMSEESAICLKN